jgi:hypothetical protein
MTHAPDAAPDPAADAAALRLAFLRATETYPAHVAAFLSKDGEAAFRAWWGQLYEAVRDHTAGLEVLAELARLRERSAHDVRANHHLAGRVAALRKALGEVASGNHFGTRAVAEAKAALATDGEEPK